MYVSHLFIWRCVDQTKKFVKVFCLSENTEREKIHEYIDQPQQCNKNVQGLMGKGQWQHHWNSHHVIGNTKIKISIPDTNYICKHLFKLDPLFESKQFCYTRFGYLKDSIIYPRYCAIMRNKNIKYIAHCCALLYDLFTLTI